MVYAEFCVEFFNALCTVGGCDEKTKQFSFMNGIQTTPFIIITKFSKKRSKPWQQLLVQFSGNYCLIIYINGSLELKRYEKWPSHIDKLLEKGSKTVLKLPKIRICRPWKHAPILDWYRQKPIFGMKMA